MSNPLADIASSINEINNSSGDVIRAMGEINNSVLKTGDSMKGISDSLGSASSALKNFGKGLGGLVSIAPGLGLIGDAFEGIGNTLAAGVDGIKLFGDGLHNMVKFGDELTSVQRSITESNYDLAVQFGGTLSEAKKFSNFMTKSAADLSTADFGWQSFATDSIAMTEALARNGISFEKMEQTVSNTSKSMNLYSIALLQAQSLGLKQEEYAKLMSDAIMSQGMSVQQASETMAMYGSMSKETGLRIETVSDSLNGLGNSFKKMGLNARFGQSFLSSFASSLKETGLGIENAGDLAQSFGEAMANLSTNYGSAFVTAKQGGMDMGSGGALGAGIQMQAKMMDPNTDKAQLGKELGMSLAETLKDFTGGNLVTVQKAAESKDPRLEQAYYTQVELLKSIYGISDPQVAARTLEMLDKLNSAQTSGDTDLQAKLGSQLEDVLGARADTKSEESKINAQLNGSMVDNIAALGENTLAMSKLQTSMLESTVMAGVKSVAGDMFSKVGGQFPGLKEEMEKLLKDSESGKITGVEAYVKAFSDTFGSGAPKEDKKYENHSDGGEGSILQTLLSKVLSVKVTSGLEDLPKIFARELANILKPGASTGGTGIPGAHG